MAGWNWVQGALDFLFHFIFMDTFICIRVLLLLLLLQGIKFGTNNFVVHLSVMQNQYRHKRWIVCAKTVIVR